MYTINGCTNAMGRYSDRNLGEATDARYEDVVRFAWRKISKTKLLPLGDLAEFLPDINLDVILPDMLENIFVELFISETESKIKSAIDKPADTHLYIGDLCDHMATLPLDKARDYLRTVISPDRFRAIEETNTVEALGAEAGIGSGVAVTDLEFPMEVGLVFVSPSGPAGGKFRKKAISNMSRELQKFVMQALKEKFGFEPPERETFVESFVKEAKAHASAMAFGSVVTDVEAMYNELLPKYTAWLDTQKPALYNYGSMRQVWQATRASMIAHLAQEIQRAYIEEQGQYPGLIAIKPVHGEYQHGFEPVMPGTRPKSGLPVVPLAIGAAVLLYAMRK